jgi:hypothetical protein
VLKEAALDPQDVAEVVHGTTVASNTILQKVGARTGLLTTRGFRDVLEIGRIRTPDMFKMAWRKPEPLVPRRWRLEVRERIGATGAVVTPLDEDSVREAMPAGFWWSARKAQAAIRVPLAMAAAPKSRPSPTPTWCWAFSIRICLLAAR